MIEFTLEKISPVEAQRILTEHDEAIESGEIINRNRKPAAIRRYAADLISGQWYAETGETLKFQTLDKTLRGRNLLDGQTRLAACVQSDVPIQVYIARGVAKEAFGYIDGGEKRSLKDILRIGNESDPVNLSRALYWLCQWDADAGKLINAPVTTQKARRLLDSDPAIRKSVSRAKQVKESGLMSIGLAAFLHRIFSNHDPALADTFISAIASGARLDESDPFFMLRQKLIENKGSRRKLNQKDIVLLAVKAFVAKRTGHPMRRLAFNRKGEDVPRLEFTAVQTGETVFQESVQ